MTPVDAPAVVGMPPCPRPVEAGVPARVSSALAALAAPAASSVPVVVSVDAPVVVPVVI